MLSRLWLVARTVPEAVEGDGAAPLLRRGALAYVETGALDVSLASLRGAVNVDGADRRALALLNRLEKKAGIDETSLAPDMPAQSLAEQKIVAARRAAYDGLASVAVKRAQEAVELEPRNLTAIKLLGSAYYLAGDLAKARQTWNRVRDIDPQDAEIPAFLNRIDR